MLPIPAPSLVEETIFTRNRDGKPLIPLESPNLFGFGTLIREAETALLRLFGEGRLSGTTHTCIGQEFCQMSVVRALNEPDDIVLSNHRNHGHFLTYSGDFEGLIAEIMGRETGVCGGIGGSQHLALRGFHSNGVQGGMSAIGVGHAMAIRIRGGSGVVAIVIGDGTLGQGLIYESLNLASVWRLPVLFVVENNGIAQTTPTSWTTGGTIEGRARAFGLDYWRFDDAGEDFFRAVESVVGHVRTLRRPGLLQIDTRRLGPHSKGDDLRDGFEMDSIRSRDPLTRLGERLAAGLAEEIRQSAREFIAEAVARAERSRPASALHAARSIFPVRLRAFEATEALEGANATDAEPRGNVRQSLNAALRSLLEASREVILLGEDLHDPYGGAFKVTAGLSTDFPDRVISTPISEAGVVGSAIGLALAGFRPVVEIMFADFITLAFDQIANHAVKFPGMFPDSSVPLVVRTPAGGRRGYGPTHSQSPENLLCGVPGLTVIFPSARHDPGVLLGNAVLRWPWPTVFLEHKLLYGVRVDAGDYTLCQASGEDAGGDLFPTLVRHAPDPDVTLVAYGGMVETAEAVAAELEAEELSVQIVIPALLSPLPRHTLIRLLADQPRVVVIEESHSEFSFAAELGTSLLEGGFKGQFTRVGTPPVPIPAARSLESLVIPDKETVLQAILRLFAI